ncbi:DUF4142 domain-containing protein [Sediminibacterium ginsengisoli]|uniref:Putative membrane protein n=1 Tax=Sediminibacterium ginsengisoli TaxID=413434 RepID=A0A1T4RCA2_9BACT|nr:DUF4142 domain-containing protein [Sediminibacterium ginsengisoli]SKA13368.1 putative membrane protein [Sediminibacterium ginsengisoli]
MKKIAFILLAGGLVMQACNNGDKNKDSVDSANQANKEAAAPGSDTTTAPVMTVDKESADFAVKAANGGMMEVDLGRWAESHASAQSVKDFGSMMASDHSKANEELKTLAASKNITLPAAVSDDTKKHMDDMMAKKGADFDKAYVNMMVDDHKEDISLFEKAAANLADPDLKAWAAKTLPTLRKHYDAIKAIKDKMK